MLRIEKPKKHREHEATGKALSKNEDERLKRTLSYHESSYHKVTCMKTGNTKQSGKVMQTYYKLVRC